MEEPTYVALYLCLDLLLKKLGDEVSREESVIVHHAYNAMERISNNDPEHVSALADMFIRVFNLKVTSPPA